VKLLYFEACLSLSSARTRERQLKTGYGRAYLNRRLKSDPDLNDDGFAPHWGA